MPSFNPKTGKSENNFNGLDMPEEPLEPVQLETHKQKPIYDQLASFFILENNFYWPLILQAVDSE